MLEVLPFCDRETVKSPPIKITVLTFMVKKVKCGFPISLFFRVRGVRILCIDSFAA